MSSPLHHMYLIHDEENTANLLPALDPDFKPEKITLVYDASRAVFAKALDEIFAPTGIEILHCLLVNDWDVSLARESLLNHLIQYEADRWFLNIAGGSRPVCAVAHEIFHELEYPIFFADAEHAEIVWLYHPQHDVLPPPYELKQRIKLRAYFQSYLGEIQDFESHPQLSREQHALCQELAQRVYVYRDQLKRLNYLASKAQDSLRSPPLESYLTRDDGFMWLIDEFERMGVLRYDAQRKVLIFPTEEDRFFVNGGWLENYVHAEILSLKGQRPQLGEIGRSVEVVWELNGQEVRNEIDIAFIYDNQLYIVECKTKNFQETGPAQNVIYKLDTLQHKLGGARCRALFVSYHQLQNSHQRRARTLDIDLCSGSQLAQFRDHLLAWLPKD